ncbi:MAG TPA: NYN domain-containing protein [Acidimicrobiales bacterium]|jgi:predicted RNA-binding protein with PIN domain|nr:NYN domain-containing protein [Acidimicrobiales bacterium]
MEWIVDGMNLMGSRPDGWWRDRAAARRRMVTELAAFAARRQERVTVIFDGRRQTEEIAEGSEAGITVGFAPGGPNAADRVIAEMARSQAGVRVTVVTSDRPLATEVTAAGAAVMGVSAFRRLLA